MGPATSVDHADVQARALAYEVLTPLYDLALEVLGFGRSFKDGIARLAEVGTGQDVLDLGCGTGTLLQALVARQPDGRYVGLDPDPQVLARARRRLTGATVELLEGYGEELPFEADTFDLVVSTLMFHHLTDAAKQATLAEVGRVLRPAGRLLLVDFGRPRSGLPRTLLTVGSIFDGRHNMRANLAGELPALLNAADFTVFEVHPPHREVHYLLART